MSVFVTRNAWDKLSKIMIETRNRWGFLFSASSGGCNGFNFKLNLLSEDEYNHFNGTRFITTLNHDNILIVVDPMSEIYLQGTTIDYISEDIASGVYGSKFVFDVDKNLATSCGCGVSFSLK